MKRILLLLTCLLFPFLASCNQTDSADSDTGTTEIFVSAAASLSGAMKEISKEYEEKNPNVTISFNFSGSGKLAQQIQQGAPVDVFLSANQKWMDVLGNEKLILQDTRIDFAKNTLVMIGKKDAHLPLDSFTSIQPTIAQIAIGNPESVPAGSYAKEALQHIDKWDALTDQFVYAKDVTQVLSYVESGNTAIGFVYGSDTLRSDKVNVLAEAKADWYTPIVYPGAVTSTSDNTEAAKDFVTFLTSDHAQKTLADFGFTNN
ncbi:molybdate ABC transporter substrate-binding protein [Lentibacillus sp. Marseille-P4043]|uniref:molybdate ABC transporter substrate-binding protein n=1 Tax=Lentibacillus sp. Marseille-P4043 TaxID=2040293 RepID=UPI000D0B05B7|nr:molybdate ABC transporter substrate-binding protein [Lentibacillus sp. Marseille-P4043]